MARPRRPRSLLIGAAGSPTASDVRHAVLSAAGRNMVGTPGKNARVALAAPTDDCRGDWDVVPHRVVESQAREFLADKYGAVDGAATTRGRLLVLRLLLLAGWPSLVVRFDAETLARTELSTWRTDAGNLDVLAEDGVA